MEKAIVISRYTSTSWGFSPSLVVPPPASLCLSRFFRCLTRPGSLINKVCSPLTQEQSKGRSFSSSRAREIGESSLSLSSISNFISSLSLSLSLLSLFLSASYRRAMFYLLIAFPSQSRPEIESTHSRAGVPVRLLNTVRLPQTDFQTFSRSFTMTCTLT